MAQFQKIPVDIEAVQWLGNNDQEMIEFAGEGALNKDVGPNEYLIPIKDSNEFLRVKVGDWLIRGVEGELYPCSPSVFAKTYKPL